MVGGIRGRINRRLHIYWTFLLQHLMRACSLVIECNVSTNFFKELHFGVGTGRSDDFEAFVFGELNNQAEIENGKYVKWSHHSDSLGTLTIRRALWLCVYDIRYVIERSASEYSYQRRMKRTPHHPRRTCEREDIKPVANIHLLGGWVLLPTKYCSLPCIVGNFYRRKTEDKFCKSTHQACQACQHISTKAIFPRYQFSDIVPLCVRRRIPGNLECEVIRGYIWNAVTAIKLTSVMAIQMISDRYIRIFRSEDDTDTVIKHPAR